MGGCGESDSRMRGARSQSNVDPGKKISVVIGAPLELCEILEDNSFSEQWAQEVGGELQVNGSVRPDVI